MSEDWTVQCKYVGTSTSTCTIDWWTQFSIFFILITSKNFYSVRTYERYRWRKFHDILEFVNVLHTVQLRRYIFDQKGKKNFLATFLRNNDSTIELSKFFQEWVPDPHRSLFLWSGSFWYAWSQICQRRQSGALGEQGKKSASSRFKRFGSCWWKPVRLE